MRRQLSVHLKWKRLHPLILEFCGWKILYALYLGVRNFYLVAPDQREKDVMAQLARPAFRNDLADPSLSFIPFDDLQTHCEAMCKFGEDHTIVHKIARHPHQV